MEPTGTTVPVCYRHPDRITGLSCSRCGKPICVECSHDASVGQLCPECAAPSDRHQVIRGRQVYGRPSFQTAPVSFSIMAITVAIYLAGLLSTDLHSLLFENLAQANWLVAGPESVIGLDGSSTSTRSSRSMSSKVVATCTPSTR